MNETSHEFRKFGGVKATTVLLTMALCAAMSPVARSQTPSTAESAEVAAVTTAAPGWSFVVAPYFLAPSMTGTTGIGDLTADIDVGPAEIFDNLQFGAMVYTEARKGLWSAYLDIIYMDLGQEGTTRLGTAEVDMQQWAVMLGAYRRLSPRIEVMAGVLFNSLSAGLVTSGPLGIDRDADESWIDPMIGGRAGLIDSGRWGLSLTANVGGFGVGSDFTWQVYPLLTYRLSKSVDLGFAYRALGIDYENGSGSTKFVYDMTTFGPELGIGIRF